jgi:hypothetical protein
VTLEKLAYALNVVGGISYLVTITVSVYLLAPTSRLEFAIRGSKPSSTS